MKIYLASKSPRRRDLLTQMNVIYESLSIDTPEFIHPGEKPEVYSKRVTLEKMLAAWQYIVKNNMSLMPILCADTEVIFENKILGKPRDRQDAFDMLKKYSGHTHQVLTSVGLIYQNYQKIQLNQTLVTFVEMSDDDINHYLAYENYQDKAGAYGIQSAIGQFISRIEGDFYSVMGLPLNTVRELLQELQNEYGRSTFN